MIDGAVNVRIATTAIDLRKNASHGIGRDERGQISLFPRYRGGRRDRAAAAKHR